MNDPDPLSQALKQSRALLEMGRFDDASDALRRVLTLDPENVEAHTNLAFSALRRQDNAAARDAARRAISLDSENNAAPSILAIALARLGQTKKLEVALRAVALAPRTFAAISRFRPHSTVAAISRAASPPPDAQST